MNPRDHGTVARYKWGPDENDTPGRPCHCTRCRAASRAEDNRRTRLIAYGQWEPFVDAGPAREHIRMLSASGIGGKRVAKLAGIGAGTLSQILYGGPGGRPPTRRIRPETAAAILAVRPAPELFPSRVAVDPAGTRRRLQALIAIGWSQAKLAGRLGQEKANFGRLLHRRSPVTAATARAVRLLYDELWNQPPPEDSAWDKRSVSRARDYARARGWVPPGAWDDDRIDAPDATPAENWERSRRKHVTGAELAEEARELAGFGLTRVQAAERLGVPRHVLEKTLSRFPAPAEREAA